MSEMPEADRPDAKTDRLLAEVHDPVNAKLFFRQVGGTAGMRCFVCVLVGSTFSCQEIPCPRPKKKAPPKSGTIQV